jgi:uncharacterized membrane protein YeaQ/YmgE (transglycosylase-associated protein family)
VAQLCGASCGLLLFSAMVVCGMIAGNPVETITVRAIGGLFGGLMLGMVAGWIGTIVVQDIAQTSGGDDEVVEAVEIEAPAEAQPQAPTQS